MESWAELKGKSAWLYFFSLCRACHCRGGKECMGAEIGRGVAGLHGLGFIEVGSGALKDIEWSLSLFH